MYNQIRRQEKKEDLIRQVQQAAGGECQHDTENSSAKLIQSDFQEIDSATIADSTLANVITQAIHTLNDTASQFATHSSTIAASGLTLAAGIGFVPGLIFGFKRG